MDKNSVKLLIFSVEGIKSKRQEKRKLGHVVQTQVCRKRDCKDDVTREDSQRRYLAQHTATTLLRHCLE